MKYQTRGLITFNAAAFYTDIKDLQVTVDAGSCSSRVVFNVPRRTPRASRRNSQRSPLPGLDLSLAGSWSKPSSTRPSTERPLATAPASATATACRRVPKFQMAATATYGQRFSDNAEWYVDGSLQHVGSRYTQPGDQENNPRHLRPSGLADPDGTSADAVDTTAVDLKLPAYDLVNLSAGLEFDSGLEVVALRQQSVRRERRSCRSTASAAAAPASASTSASRGRSA